MNIYLHQKKKKRHGKQAEVLGKGLKKDINRCF